MNSNFQKANLVKYQSDFLKTFLLEFSNNKKYALIDYPDHSNVGDSAIWLGELKILVEIFGCKPAYVSTMYNYDHAAMRRKVGNGVIFIHGGGNFGDIWEKHQIFRENIITNFPDNKIVQLPQSIKFYDQQKINSSAQVINRHKDFHLLVRDLKSYEFAKTNYQCNVTLSPDAAFGIGNIEPAIKPKYDVVFLSRTDLEKQQASSINLEEADLTYKKLDWLSDGKFFQKKAILLAIFYYLTGLFVNPYRLCLQMAKAKLRLNRGVRILSSGKVVLTDRLHAHIISLLLNKPNVVIDNNYGKVSGYVNQWTKDYENFNYFKSTAELEKIVKKL